MVTHSKVEAKKDEMEANVQASQEEALGPEGVGEPGGDPVYLDRPGGPDAKQVKVGKAGSVASSAIWEEVYQNNSNQPTYILRVPDGGTVPLDMEQEFAHFTMWDTGPNANRA